MVGTPWDDCFYFLSEIGIKVVPQNEGREGCLNREEIKICM